MLDQDAGEVTASCKGPHIDMATPVIEIRDVSFSYNGRPVLEDVTLTIQDRDFVCVLGPNGGGKTTLVKLMLGLLEPKKGAIEILGKSPGRAREDVGYLAQNPQLDPRFPVTVTDVVLMGRLGAGRSIGPHSREDMRVAGHALEDVGLSDFADATFSSLSGGQRQRALIARALACEPKILLLDEPTANLDPAVQEDLYRLLSDLNERLTILIVSHDIGFVSTFFRSVVCVNRSVHTHPTDELTSANVANLYGREVRVLHGGSRTPSEAEP